MTLLELCLSFYLHNNSSGPHNYGIKVLLLLLLFGWSLGHGPIIIDNYIRQLHSHHYLYL